MPAFLEKVRWRVWALRAGPHALEMGDPYTASGTVVGSLLWWRRAKIIAFTRRESDTSSALQMQRDIDHCLRGVGIKSVDWDRIKKNRVRHIKKRLKL